MKPCHIRISIELSSIIVYSNYLFPSVLYTDSAGHARSKEFLHILILLKEILETCSKSIMI